MIVVSKVNPLSKYFRLTFTWRLSGRIKHFRKAVDQNTSLRPFYRHDTAVFACSTNYKRSAEAFEALGQRPAALINSWPTDKALFRQRHKKERRQMSVRSICNQAAVFQTPLPHTPLFPSYQLCAGLTGFECFLNCILHSFLFLLVQVPWVVLVLTRAAGAYWCLVGRVGFIVGHRVP